MAGKSDIEMLAKTIDKAIEQARDLGMPMAVHILMMARIEVEQSKRSGAVVWPDETPTLKN